MHILVLQFRTNDYSQLVEDLDAAADWMNTLPGLQSKTWLQDEKSQKIGGVYHFDTMENLLSYKHSNELHEFKQKYAVIDWQESCFTTREVDKASAKNNSPFFR